MAETILIVDDEQVIEKSSDAFSRREASLVLQVVTYRMR
jgi:hypothetical protein